MRFGNPPIGTIASYGGNTDPQTTPNVEWLICDGRSMSQLYDPDLFAVIGTTFGNGDPESPRQPAYSLPAIAASNGISSIIRVR